MRTFVLRDACKTNIVHNILLLRNNAVTRHMVQQKIIDITEDYARRGIEWHITDILYELPKEWGALTPSSDFESIESLYI